MKYMIIGFTYLYHFASKFVVSISSCLLSVHPSVSPSYFSYYRTQAVEFNFRAASHWLLLAARLLAERSEASNSWKKNTTENCKP